MPITRCRRSLVRVVLAMTTVLAVTALFTVEKSNAALQSGTSGSASGLPVLQASNPAAIKEHIGDQVIVTGVIKSAQWSQSGKVMNISFEGADPEAFGVAIFESARKRFDESFGGDFGKTITGAEVRLRGFVKEYAGRDSRFEGRPELILSDPSQVTIVESEPTTQPATKPTTRATDVNDSDS